MKPLNILLLLIVGNFYCIYLQKHLKRTNKMEITITVEERRREKGKFIAKKLDEPTKTGNVEADSKEEKNTTPGKAFLVEPVDEINLEVTFCEKSL